VNVHRSARMWNLWAQQCGFPTIATYLHARYIEDKMSLEKLGLHLGIKRDRVAQMLRKYDIPVRGRGGVR
jgi:hypothetical protein